ncbi:ornithine cyclodeaminase family protein [Xenorhabdus budapestensis]|uniref:Ornithine cyclodeaminase n=1 Tax=Xenorhabdus budapestensis TaxID=290110 RepID=A0A2D0IMH8_XENBU|nr:ornithine cyclodeaminase family protein [Xenorhabdus budapestensis]PHM23038.1 ornithine cyclodeaminase [Xenorhabdus budapestensis]
MSILNIGAFGWPLLPELTDLKPLISYFKESFSNGRAEAARVPARSMIIKQSPFSAFGAMPAYCPNSNLFITKVATLVVNGEKKGNSVNAIVNVFDGTTGKPLALLDGAQLTNLKCAAVSAMVTDICASDDANKMALIGCGTQAWQQVLAVMAVRPIRQIRLYGRTSSNTLAFAKKIEEKFGSNIEVLMPASVTDTVSNTDIICTATTSRSPLFSNVELTDHVHVNCMGAHTCDSREVPNTLLQSAHVIVEDLDTAVAEAGELHRDALTLTKMLTFDRNKLKNTATVFSSVGHGYLDLLATAYLLQQSQNP